MRRGLAGGFVGDVENVELAASGGFSGMVFGGVMADVIAVDDVLFLSSVHDVEGVG